MTETHRKNVSVLVVDDETTARLLLVHNLKSLEIGTILEATDGIEARDILSERDVDLVITDLMKGMIK